MSKIALITDNHHGTRGESQFFLDKAEMFFNEQFFPYLRKNNIKTIVHLGDILDKRKSVNFMVAQSLRNCFIKHIVDDNIECHIIMGNHDAYFKSSNSIFGFRELFDDVGNIITYSSVTEVKLFSMDAIFIPWINSENQDKTLEAIAKTKSKFAFGHLELNGFTMYKGSVCHEGHDPSFLRKFTKVFSGHFHSRSNRDNIYYLGSPFETNWADFDDPKGFHVFDTETGELEFIVNPDTIFNKIFYDDSELDLNDIKNMSLDEYKDKIVKVIVINKSKTDLFDIFIEKLENVNTNDFTIVDDNLGLDLIDDEDIVSESEDTLTIIKKKIKSSIDNKKQQKKLETIMTSLYNEALMST